MVQLIVPDVPGIPYINYLTNKMTLARSEISFWTGKGKPKVGYPADSDDCGREKVFCLPNLRLDNHNYLWFIVTDL